MNDEDQDAEGAQLLIEKNYEKKNNLVMYDTRTWPPLSPQDYL